MFKYGAIVLALCAVVVPVCGREYDSRLGTTEISGGGGIAFTPSGFGNRPLLATDLQVSLSRYLSIGGGVSYFWGNEPLGPAITYKIDALMYGGNWQFHIPTGTRIAPFLTGGLGAMRSSLSGKVAGVNLGALVSETVFASNYGGGVRIYLRPAFGIKTEFRAIKARDTDWFSTVTTGIFYQFGKD